MAVSFLPSVLLDTSYFFNHKYRPEVGNTLHPSPDSKIHGANIGPTWVLPAPGGPHVGPKNLAVRESFCLQVPSLMGLSGPCCPPLFRNFSRYRDFPYNLKHPCSYIICRAVYNDSTVTVVNHITKYLCIYRVQKIVLESVTRWCLSLLLASYSPLVGKSLGDIPSDIIWWTLMPWYV